MKAMQHYVLWVRRGPCSMNEGRADVSPPGLSLRDESDSYPTLVPEAGSQEPSSFAWWICHLQRIII